MDQGVPCAEVRESCVTVRGRGCEWGGWEEGGCEEGAVRGRGCEEGGCEWERL